jgi:hypothetical protein
VLPQLVHVVAVFQSPFTPVEAHVFAARTVPVGTITETSAIIIIFETTFRNLMTFLFLFQIYLNILPQNRLFSKAKKAGLFREFYHPKENP